MYSSAVVSCAAKTDAHVRLDALDGELLAVEQQLVAADLRAPEQLTAGVHGGLGGTLRAPHPRELRLGLGAPAVVEELLVDVELDAVGAQPIGEPDGKFVRHARALQPETPDGAERELRSTARVGRSRTRSARRAELLAQVDVEEPELAQAGGLHRAAKTCRLPFSSA